MAYNEILADRIRESLSGQPNVEEKKMMGGLTFMVNDKMCVGILQDDLMARIDPEMQGEALKKTGCKVMDFTGRISKGFVLVEPHGIRTKRELDYWVGLALDYNERAKSSRKAKKK
jgi:TfoX/Sxy family transcriptional regulator of competence genes